MVKSLSSSPIATTFNWFCFIVYLVVSRNDRMNDCKIPSSYLYSQQITFSSSFRSILFHGSTLWVAIPALSGTDANPEWWWRCRWRRQLSGYFGGIARYPQFEKKVTVLCQLKFHFVFVFLDRIVWIRMLEQLFLFRFLSLQFRSERSNDAVQRSL